MALIGDVVGSRQQDDRAVVQQALVAALAEVEGRVPSLQPLAVTIGDEFQAVYATLADAATAALLVRLTLLPHADTRYGLGRGAFTVFDAERDPVSQDGPAWWAAREAVETARRRASAPRSRSVRTWFRTAAGDRAEPGEGVVNAFLTCRDDVLGRMRPRELRLLRALALGHQQNAMAEAEGVSQSAVSQALTRSGAYAVLAAQELLREAP